MTYRDLSTIAASGTATIDAALATVHRIQAGMVQSNTVYVTYSG